MDRVDCLSALFQQIGSTVWNLQELETTAAVYLVVRVKATRGIGRERGEAILRSVEKRTLGSLINELEKAAIVPKEISDRLQAISEERNWLVHRSRRESRGLLVSFQKFELLLKRVESINDEAILLLKRLANEIENFVIAAGVDKARIDSDAERLSREMGLIE